jgi:hypothetical protein
VNQYRTGEKFRELSKPNYPKVNEETKAQIDALQKVREMLLIGSVSAHTLKTIADIQESIAILSAHLHKPGRPPDLLCFYVGNLARFVKQKTRKYH